MKKATRWTIGGAIAFIGLITVVFVVWAWVDRSTRSDASGANTKTGTVAATSPSQSGKLSMQWSENFYIPERKRCSAIPEKGATLVLRDNEDDALTFTVDENNIQRDLNGKLVSDVKVRVQIMQVRGTNSNIGKTYAIYCW